MRNAHVVQQLNVNIEPHDAYNWRSQWSILNFEDFILQRPLLFIGFVPSDVLMTFYA